MSLYDSLHTTIREVLNNTEGEHTININFNHYENATIYNNGLGNKGEELNINIDNINTRPETKEDDDDKTSNITRINIDINNQDDTKEGGYEDDTKEGDSEDDTKEGGYEDDTKEGGYEDDTKEGGYEDDMEEIIENTSISSGDQPSFPRPPTNPLIPYRLLPPLPHILHSSMLPPIPLPGTSLRPATTRSTMTQSPLLRSRSPTPPPPPPRRFPPRLPSSLPPPIPEYTFPQSINPRPPLRLPDLPPGLLNNSMFTFTFSEMDDDISALTTNLNNISNSLTQTINESINNINNEMGVTVKETIDHTKINLYKDVHLENKENACPICDEEYDELSICRINNKCNHFFHIHCIDNWYSNNIKCPSCNQIIF